MKAASYAGVIIHRGGSCRCRDTGAKRCRQEFSTPDPFRSATWSPGKQERLDWRSQIRTNHQQQKDEPT